MVWRFWSQALINILDENYYKIFGEGALFGVPAPILWTVAVAVVGIVLLHLSRFGRQIYATGGNSTAARYTGINTKRVKTICLVIAGALSGLAALVLTARSHAARPMPAPASNLTSSPQSSSVALRSRADAAQLSGAYRQSHNRRSE